MWSAVFPSKAGYVPLSTHKCYRREWKIQNVCRQCRSRLALYDEAVYPLCLPLTPYSPSSQFIPSVCPSTHTHPAVSMSPLSGPHTILTQQSVCPLCLALTPYSPSSQYVPSVWPSHHTHPAVSMSPLSAPNPNRAGLPLALPIVLPFEGSTPSPLGAFYLVCTQFYMLS